MDEMELGGGCWKLASARKRPDLLSVIAAGQRPATSKVGTWSSQRSDRGHEGVDPDGGGWRRCSVARVGAALEGLNDDHAAAATGAFVCLSIVRRGFDRGCSCSQQHACACDVLSTTGAGTGTHPGITCADWSASQ